MAARWEMFYTARDSEVVEALTRESFAVHYWNNMRVRQEAGRVTPQRYPTSWRKHSSGRLAMNRSHPLYKIFEANCPLTYEHLLRNMQGTPY